ncbi:hypothetical protein D3C73_1170910 [compost metagenome]
MKMRIERYRIILSAIADALQVLFTNSAPSEPFLFCQRIQGYNLLGLNEWRQPVRMDYGYIRPFAEGERGAEPGIIFVRFQPELLHKHLALGSVIIPDDLLYEFTFPAAKRIPEGHFYRDRARLRALIPGGKLRTARQQEQTEQQNRYKPAYFFHLTSPPSF